MDAPREDGPRFCSAWVAVAANPTKKPIPMKTSSRFNLLSLIAALIAPILPAAMLMLSAQTSHAGSATWNLNPGSGNWNSAANWTPIVVPNGAADTATFVSSNMTSVSISANTQVDGIVFNAGASAFTIAISPTLTLTIPGMGVTNNSGITQNFVNNADATGRGVIHFSGSATAGSGNLFTNNGRASALAVSGGRTEFFNSSTAGTGTFVQNGGSGPGGDGGRALFTNSSTAGNGTFTTNAGVSGAASGGVISFIQTASAGNGSFTNNGSASSDTVYSFVQFGDSATAGNGNFTNNGGTAVGARGSYTAFFASSTAGSGNFTNNGSAAVGADGGATQFSDTSTASNAILIANTGSSGGFGGAILINNDSTGGTATVKVFGNGEVDLSFHNAPGTTIGSLEGSGDVFLGARNLTVGSNNLDTTFSGLIQDGGFVPDIGGSFTKIGSGTLTFQGRATNDYIANTVNLGLVSGSIINLNFSGASDTIRSLTVDGVAQVPGIYGSTASGAPHQLPQFTGTGTVQVTMLATSRKTHGAAGAFDVPLPLAGSVGIECRSGGASNDYQVVATFFHAVTFDHASVASGIGSITSATGSGTTTLTVNLTGVTNAQTITITLASVNDGISISDIAIPMGILIGDTNGDRLVNSGDSTQTKNRAGQPAGATNFRSDVNEDGVINSGDSSVVKSRAGTSLPEAARVLPRLLSAGRCSSRAVARRARATPAKWSAPFFPQGKLQLKLADSSSSKELPNPAEASHRSYEHSDVKSHSVAGIAWAGSLSLGR